jgi:hypothetical protein
LEVLSLFGGCQVRFDRYTFQGVLFIAKQLEMKKEEGIDFFHHHHST